MICHEHRAIFIHIQKTGGVSICAALGLPWATPNRHWLARDLKGVCDPRIWRDYFKFVFVRNPWARLVSWWSMIDALRPAFEAGVPYNRFQTAVLLRCKNFADFLHFEEEVAEPGGSVKSLFRNQLDYLTDENGEVLVDFIGRFESLERDWDTVRTRLAGEVAALPRLNTSTHGDYRQYYTPELARIVEQRYARDIERFEYEFGA